MLRTSRIGPGVLLVLALGGSSPAWADPSALVLPVSGDGVDPVVVQLLSNALRDRVQSRGYTVSPSSAGPAADPEGLRRAAATAGAVIGVSARIAIPSVGRYRFTLTTVAATGNRIWTADEETAGADVLALLDRMITTGVPPASELASDGLPPIVGASPNEGLPPVISNAPPSVAPSGPPVVQPAPGPQSPPEDEEDTLRLERVHQRQVPRWMVGALNEAVVGTNRGFFNYLAGARLQVAFNQQFFGFATAAYAYYSDDPGFAMVVHAGMEGRVRVGRTGNIGLPFRFSLGYAPENGGLLKLDMGLSIALGPRTDLVIIPLAPTVWFLDGGNAVSMNFAIEINVGL